jgi:adenylate kinase
MIVSISGTPGTGKTEVAKALAERLDWDLIELNELAKLKGMYSGYDEARKCKIVDVVGLKREVEELSKNRKNLVLESHYAHDMPCDTVVILRTNPVELRRRLVGKGWTKKKIDENIQAEIMEVCKSEALEQDKQVMEFDTSGKTGKMIASEIMKRLRF